MSNAIEQVQVRLPIGMRDKLKAVAKASHRSVNAQIISILEVSLGAAAGGSIGVQAPAAGSEAAAR